MENPFKHIIVIALIFIIAANIFYMVLEVLPERVYKARSTAIVAGLALVAIWVREIFKNNR